MRVCPICGYKLLWREDGVMYCVYCGYKGKGIEK